MSKLRMLIAEKVAQLIFDSLEERLDKTYSYLDDMNEHASDIKDIANEAYECADDLRTAIIELQNDLL